MATATKLGRMVLFNEEFPSIKSQGFWSRGRTRSHEKLDLLYPYYYKAYGNQICLGSDLQWQVCTHKVIQSFEHVVG